MSCIIRKLPYVDYNNIWIVPLGHNLLFGVVASFINHIFRSVKRPSKGEAYEKDVVPHADRAIIEQRGNDLHVPSEFGRKYKSVLQYRGSYTMEDWLHFVLAFSPYLFALTLPQDLAEMWELLVTVVDHYFHAVATVSYTDEGSRKAGDALLKYAQLVERRMPSKCTHNLHVAVCR